MKGVSGITVESRLTMPDEHVKLILAMVDAVHAIAALPHDPAHLERLLHQALWDVTQFKQGPLHKCGGLRWRTVEAHAIAKPPWKELRHEHVVELAWVKRLLRVTPDAAETVLWNLPVALVTERQANDHLRAAARWGSGWGWARYTAVPLTVLDARTGSALDLPLMNEALRDVYRPLVDEARAAGGVL